MVLASLTDLITFPFGSMNGKYMDCLILRSVDLPHAARTTSIFWSEHMRPSEVCWQRNFGHLLNGLSWSVFFELSLLSIWTLSQGLWSVSSSVSHSTLLPVSFWKWFPLSCLASGSCLLSPTRAMLYYTTTFLYLLRNPLPIFSFTWIMSALFLLFFSLASTQLIL